MAVAPARLNEYTRLFSWRAEQYVRLGADRDIAEILAADDGFDYHEIERLVARGCPLKMAVAIVWPVT